MSELKLFIVIGLLALGVFGTYQWLSNTKVPYRPPPPTPTITFVPKGTPGAKTLDELNDERFRFRRRR